ncbi:hypothetical protein HK405_005033, partial [Cladochytrium tenue]
VLGLKVLVKRIQGCSRTIAAELAAPVFRLLNKLIKEEGELVGNSKIPTCAACKSQLRLAAAVSVLKLSRIPECAALVTVADRARLLLSIQDPAWQVRDAFVEKLARYLQNRSVPFSFAVVLAMAGHEPDPSIKQKAFAVLSRMSARHRSAEDKPSQATIESLFPNFLHTISLHPDFGTDDDDVEDSAKYIQFFLDVVASPDNVSFLYHSAAQLKTLADIHKESSEGLYHVSDLAQILIQELCANRVWSLPSYPTNIRYDKELFRRLPSRDGAENLKKSYLSKKFVFSRQASAAAKQKIPRTPRSAGRRRSRSIIGTPGPVSDDEGGDAATGSTRKKRAPRRADDRSDDEEGGAPPTPVPRRVSAPRSAKASRKRYFEESSSGEEDGAGDSGDGGDDDSSDEFKVGAAAHTNRPAKTARRGPAPAHAAADGGGSDDHMDEDEENDEREEEEVEEPLPRRRARGPAKETPAATAAAPAVPDQSDPLPASSPPKSTATGPPARKLAAREEAAHAEPVASSRLRTRPRR